MSLQSKFAVLLALLALVGSLTLGAALVFGELLQRELVWPFESSSTVMRELSRLKRSVEAQIRLFPSSRLSGRIAHGAGGATTPEPASPDLYADCSAVIDSSIETMRRNPWFTERVGVSTQRALTDLIAAARTAADAHRANPTPESADAAGTAHFEVHELIEKIEERILRDAVFDISYGERLRVLHRRVILAGIGASAVVAVLGVLLVRRWVTRPVAQLRTAADEIARGRFDHRIPVVSSDELGQLSGEVNHMAQTIGTMQTEAVERERLAATGEMVRRLAHNLRNPLAGIRSIAELTRKRAASDEKLRADQQEIILAVDRFNVWLTELLDATSPLRINTAPLEPRPWLRGILDAHRPLARMRSVELRDDIDRAPPLVHADQRHLEHAVVAILTNAIQASDAGKPVTLRAAPAPDDPAHWLIEIEDLGPGIPSDIREKIFRPYFTTKRDGNGIGLAVAQQVVKQHSGRIDVESVVGNGTTFRIRLPIGGMIDSDQADLSHAADPSREGATRAHRINRPDRAGD